MAQQIDDKKRWGLTEVLSLSWPASLTMLNSTLLRFVDGLMVAFVSPAAFSAQFLGGMFAFIPESLALGTLMVVNTFVSQNYGAGRFKRTGAYVWAGLAVAMLSACMIAPLALLAKPIFSPFGHPADVQAQEMTYFRYMAVSALATLPARVLEQFFFGIHRPRIVLAASLIANAFNVLANWVLIFGKLGFPAMGLEGAAIGSLASWIIQLILLAGVFFSPAMRKRYATHLYRMVRLRHCFALLRVGWPAGVQFCNDVACWSLFTAALVGRFGTVHLAASTAAMRYIGLSFMPAVGIGIATTALVGKCIGENRPDLARRRTHVAMLVATAYMGLCGLAFYLFRHPMVEFFVRIDPSTLGHGAAAAVLREQIVRIGGNIMLCAAVFQLFDAVGIVYIGALRGAGDTFWPMRMTILLSWGLVVGGGAAAVKFAPQTTSIGPWIAASLYVVVLGMAVAWRFESGAWQKIDLLHRKALEPQALAGVPKLGSLRLGALIAAKAPLLATNQPPSIVPSPDAKADGPNNQDHVAD
jgi:MATE family multidrug resistance protein